MFRFISTIVVVVTFVLGLNLATAQQSQPVEPGSREAIQLVQEQLVSLGFDPGKPDGLMGRQTRNAIRAFETSIGVDPAGEVTAELLDQIGAAQNARDVLAAIDANDMAALDAALAKATAGPPILRDGKIAEALRRSVKDDRIELAHRLIKAGYATAANQASPPLLHLAIANKNTEMVGLIAGNLDDLERQDANGVPALTRAIRENLFDAALALIRAGADATNDSDRGYTPIHWAIARSQPDLVAAMLERGARADAGAGRAGVAPLELAITDGETEIASMLIKAGAVIEKDHAYYDGVINVYGYYGPSGLVELVERFQGLAFEKGDAVLQRTHLELKPREGFFLGGEAARLNELRQQATPEPGGSSGKISLPPGKYGELDYQIDLVTERRDIEVEGSIMRITDDGDVQQTKFLRLVPGPEGTVLGSFVIAMGEIDPPTPRERIDPVVFDGIEVPEGATIYTVNAKMQLEALR